MKKKYITPVVHVTHIECQTHMLENSANDYRVKDFEEQGTINVGDSEN